MRTKKGRKGISYVLFIRMRSESDWGVHFYPIQNRRRCFNLHVIVCNKAHTTISLTSSINISGASTLGAVHIMFIIWVQKEEIPTVIFLTINIPYEKIFLSDLLRHVIGVSFYTKPIQQYVLYFHDNRVTPIHMHVT